MLILAPLAARLIQMAISRNREYSADAAPPTTPAALRPHLRVEKLEYGPSASRWTPIPPPPTCSSLSRSPENLNLFFTHPSTEKRIARLEAIR